MSKYLKMSVDELIAEHKKLVNVLENAKTPEAKKEAKDQAAELQGYIDEKKKASTSKMVRKAITMPNGEVHKVWVQPAT